MLDATAHIKSTINDINFQWNISNHTTLLIVKMCVYVCVCTYRLQLMVPNVKIASATCQMKNSSFHNLLQLDRVYSIRIDA